MPIRLIAIDVDGTLLNSDHRLTARTKQVVQRASDAGVPVILATGRARLETTVDVIEELALTTPGIFVQGTVIHQADGSVYHRETFATDTMQHLIPIFEARNIATLAYRLTEILVKERNALTDYVMNIGEPTPRAIGSLMSIADQVNKMVLWDSAAKIAELRQELQRDYAGKVRLVQALPPHLTQGDMPISLELLPPHASKGTALEWLAADMGIALEDVLAIGDGENDVELLQTAGIGVAMQNAAPATQAVADYITADNDSDGVADAIERFVFLS